MTTDIGLTTPIPSRVLSPKEQAQKAEFNRRERLPGVRKDTVPVRGGTMTALEDADGKWIGACFLGKTKPGKPTRVEYTFPTEEAPTPPAPSPTERAQSLVFSAAHRERLDAATLVDMARSSLTQQAIEDRTPTADDLTAAIQHLTRAVAMLRKAEHMEDTARTLVQSIKTFTP